MNTHSSIAVAAATAILLACATACGKTDAQPSADPSVSASLVAPQSEPTASTEAPDTWRSAFTTDQLTSFNEALQRFEEYEQRSEPVWAAGTVTPAAEALFKEYFPAPAWQATLTRLRTYEQVEVKTTGLPTVLSSRAAEITGDASAGSVTLLQCVDYTTVSTTQFGQAVDRSTAFERPIQRTVVMKRVDGGRWLIFQDRAPTEADARSCAPTGTPS